MHTTASYAAPQFSRAGVIWLKLAITYLIIGVGLGIAMGASRNFALAPVHAHINLLGWTTMALAGLVYTVFPVAGASRLAKIHFWLINLSVPVMLGSLAVLLLGNPAIEPVLALSEIVAAIGIAAFAANIYLNVGKTVEVADEEMEAYAPARSAAR
ncbi:hypothetical protein GCM10027321_25200 [Massilia terrae]|uniref:Cbb3-type cytochrome c oxidase subunit I n=1 Tax=Massilia terrae TaxID=1811224 RepID=A0ABT2CX36_9BURK|nr:cbb3-type cytochrome c oxidase subunit I [Massilia terrae]MCS0658526.1 cbb3-type cytochrome c oxidase subunit I [Massilia terrae]